MKNIEEIKVMIDHLLKVDVNEYTEKKKNLTYLSWANAWREVIKRYPDATYQVVKDENGLPYFGDPDIGYIVYTQVTIEGLTHEMWLPVMDGNNKALKKEPYTIHYTKSSVDVNPMNMFDVNKALMRCLAKNLAMFGLGLYIYTGEDLPEDPEQIKIIKGKKIGSVEVKALESLLERANGDKKKILEHFGILELSQLNYEQFTKLANQLEKAAEELEKEKK